MPDENDIDDTLDAAADDTLAADADDTLAADADDTVVAEGGDDTVAADAGKSPFDEFDEPAKKEKKADQGTTLGGDDAPDDLDKQLEAAETALEADPSDPELVRAQVKLGRQVRQRDAKERQKLKAQVQQATEEAAYDAFERQCGLLKAPPEVREKLTRDVIKERFKKHFDAEYKASGGDAGEARGAAKANLKHEIQRIIAAASKNKPAPKTKRTETGATLSPPGGGGGRQGKAAPDPERAFIDGNWSYPNPVGEA